MKKNLLKYIFSLLIATYFLVVGVGYNVVDYCCQTCAEEGIVDVSLNSCYGLHHRANSTISFSNLNKKNYQYVLRESDSCKLFHFKTDITVKNVQKIVFEKNQHPLLLNYLFVDLFDLKFHKGILHNIHPPEHYLITSGREKITLHAVLLI